MDYFKHTQKRFFERFKNSWSFKKSGMIDLTIEDYHKMCEICKDDSKVLLQENLKKRGCRKLIYYNGISMWCVISHKSKIIKTVYPVKNKFRKIVQNTEKYKNIKNENKKWFCK